MLGQPAVMLPPGHHGCNCPDKPKTHYPSDLPRSGLVQCATTGAMLPFPRWARQNDVRRITGPKPKGQTLTRAWPTGRCPRPSSPSIPYFASRSHGEGKFCPHL